MNRSAQFLLAFAAVVSTAACNNKDDATIETTSKGETNMSASADSADPAVIQWSGS